MCVANASDKKMKQKILIARQVFPEVIDFLSPDFDIDYNEGDDIFAPETLRARVLAILDRVRGSTSR